MHPECMAPLKSIKPARPPHVEIIEVDEMREYWQKSQFEMEKKTERDFGLSQEILEFRFWILEPRYLCLKYPQSKI